MVVGQELVRIVEQTRGLDERAIDRVSRSARRPRGEPRRDLGDRPGVAEEPDRRIEGQEQLGGLDPPGNGHPLDGTAQLKARAGAHDVPTSATRRLGRTARAPVEVTVIRPPPKTTSTDPSVSVRRTRAPVAARRSSVDRAGWPYGLSGARRDDRDLRLDDAEEGRRRGGRAAMVGDLQEVDGGQAAAGEDRIDVVLDVAGEQEAPAGDLAEQDDRDVVDRAAAVGRVARHAARVRPQDARTGGRRARADRRSRAIPSGGRRGGASARAKAP